MQDPPCSPPALHLLCPGAPHVPSQPQSLSSDNKIYSQKWMSVCEDRENTQQNAIENQRNSQQTPKNPQRNPQPHKKTEQNPKEIETKPKEIETENKGKQKSIQIQTENKGKQKENQESEFQGSNGEQKGLGVKGIYEGNDRGKTKGISEGQARSQNNQQKQQTKNNALKQNSKEQTLENKYEQKWTSSLNFGIGISKTYEEMLKIYNKLHEEIDYMGETVQQMIQKNSGEFVLAYEMHSKKVKKQLNLLQLKFAEQQQQYKNDRRVLRLEKQITLFRDQSIKIYEVLERKNKQSDQMRRIISEQQMTISLLKKEIKEIGRSKKNADVVISQLQNQLANLRSFIKNNSQIIQLEKKSQARNTQENELKHLSKRKQQKYYSQVKNDQSLELRKNLESIESCSSNKRNANSQYVRFRIPSRVSDKTNSLTKGIAENKIKKSLFLQKMCEENELKNIFIDCIKTVKKQIASRKRVFSSRIFEKITPIEEFKSIDKLILLQKFVQNESLLIFMFEKMFPSRVHEIRQYLSHRSVTRNNNLRNISQNSQICLSPHCDRSMDKNMNEKLDKSHSFNIMKSVQIQDDNSLSKNKNYSGIKIDLSKDSQLSQMKSLPTNMKTIKIMDKVSIKKGRLNLRYS